MSGNRAQRRRGVRQATKAKAGQPRATKDQRKLLERAAKSDIAIPTDPKDVPVLNTGKEGLGRTPAGLLVVQDRIEH